MKLVVYDVDLCRLRIGNLSQTIYNAAPVPAELNRCLTWLNYIPQVAVRFVVTYRFHCILPDTGFDPKCT